MDPGGSVDLPAPAPAGAAEGAATGSGSGVEDLIISSCTVSRGVVDQWGVEVRGEAGVYVWGDGLGVLGCVVELWGTSWLS